MQRKNQLEIFLSNSPAGPSQSINYITKDRK